MIREFFEGGERVLVVVVLIRKGTLRLWLEMRRLGSVGRRESGRW